MAPSSLVAAGALLASCALSQPIMGSNSWTAVGTGVSADYLQTLGTFFVQSGMAAAGYRFVNSDDGWSLGQRGPDGRIVADPAKFPQGLKGVADFLHNLTIPLKFGIYSAASSVVCSGRPGSLYNEVIDAQSFADAGVDLVKYDNCGEYSLGTARFFAFADAVKATGRPMIITTEPFVLLPNNIQSQFSQFARTGNDINANWGTILDRIDRNSKWSVYGSLSYQPDPDMLQVGNGGLSIEEDRAHFGLWAITKSPLILGSAPEKLSAAQLAILMNKDVIAVSQDSLGVPARKLAVNSSLVPNFVGLAPCAAALTGAPENKPGMNGVTPLSLSWSPKALGVVNGVQAFSLVNGASPPRCLGTRDYMGRVTPLLVPCVDPSVDMTVAWSFPTGTARIGGLSNLAAVAAAAAGTNPTNATVLSVANSTLYGGMHGDDAMPLLDQAYGITVLELAPYAPEPLCDSRGCQDYAPEQSWYWSPSTGRMSLAVASGNLYRCFEGPCYQLTSHYPATEEWCLSRVASISNDPIDPTTASTGGQDVWGGPLSGGAYVFGALNRSPPAAGGGNATIAVAWDMLEVPGFTSTTSACVRELFTNTALGVQVGGVSVQVASHDLAVLRVVPGATTC